MTLGCVDIGHGLYSLVFVLSYSDERLCKLVVDQALASPIIYWAGAKNPGLSPNRETKNPVIYWQFQQLAATKRGS